MKWNKHSFFTSSSVFIHLLYIHLLQVCINSKSSSICCAYSSAGDQRIQRLPLMQADQVGFTELTADFHNWTIK